jgi:hypothetical protein
VDAARISIVTRIGKRAAWTAILALYALIALLPFERMVLCVQPDGRVGLEVAGDAAGCIDCGTAEAEESTGCCRSEASDQAPCRDVMVFEHEDPPVTPSSASVAIDTAPQLGLPSAPDPSAWMARVDRAQRVVARRAFDPPRPPPFALALVLRV